MQRIQNALAIATLLGVPLVSHADNVAPLSRVEVCSELIAAELASQIPQSKVHYPNAQPNTATAYVANRALTNGAYGSQSSDSSASGTSSLRGRNAADVRSAVVNIEHDR